MMKGVWLNEDTSTVVIIGVMRHSFEFLNLEEAKIGYEVIFKHHEKATTGRNRVPMNWEKIDRELAKKGIRYY